MGADNLGQFHLWQRWREIAELMPIAVIDRPGSTLSLHSAKAARVLDWCRVDEDDASLLAYTRPPAWSFFARAAQFTVINRTAGKSHKKSIAC